MTDNVWTGKMADVRAKQLIETTGSGLLEYGIPP